MKACIILFAVVLSLGAVACGGGDDDSGGRNPLNGDNGEADNGGGNDSDADDGDGDTGSGGRGTEEELQAAVLASFGYYLTGDIHAYYQTVVRSCREEAGWAGVSEDAKSRRNLASRFNDIDLSEVAVTSVTIDEFNGSSAVVTLAIDGTGDTTFREAGPNPWVFDKGAWRWADCEDFIPRGGGFLESSQREPLEEGFIAEVADWFIYIRGVEPKEDEFLLEEPGIEPPADGNQYFRVNVAASYNGPEVSTVFGEDLEFDLVAGGTEYLSDASCGPVPGELELDLEALPGDDMLGYVCREVDSEDVDALVLRARAKDGSGEAWFSLGN